MQILEHPYVIMTILLLCFAALGTAGVYFAMRGIKEAKVDEAADFSSIGRLEGRFERSEIFRGERCVIYINVDLDNARSVYSDSEAWRIYSAVKPILLNRFADGDSGEIAIYGQNSFVALNNRSAKENENRIEECLNEINRCFLKFNALNVAEIKFGIYSAAVSQISFGEAMGRAKQACMLAARNGVLYTEWNSCDGKSLFERINIENSIGEELRDNRFFLEYQPVVDAKTKRVAGIEVFSRLNSRGNGIILPDEFLPALDSVGLSEKFDLYIFEKNCKWISNDKAQRERYKYAINFSRITLCAPELAERVTEIADKYGIRHSVLAIEILEDKEISESEQKKIISNLAKLRQNGFLVLLDDFGSGYTSFDDLQNLAADVVKIDKTITKNTETETGAVIFKNMVRTAKDIGLMVVCEGVETEEHVRVATEAGCDMLQGFYFYRPVGVDRLEQIFKKERLDTRR